LPSKPAKSSDRIDVRKTYKLFVGGKFPRSESGRSYEIQAATTGKFLANAAMASRKDARDAVTAARKAYTGWSAATAYNRGQVLYRVAELLEGRRSQFVDEVALGEGVSRSKAEGIVDGAVDRWVWYAGWSDKVSQVAGSANQVAGPYFDFSIPEPTGVVAVLAPQSSSLLGLVSGGVVNVLTGRTAEVAPWLASHMDVNAIDLVGAADGDVVDLQVAAADNLKRVVRDRATGWAATPDLTRLRAYLETKTVWHPIGV
jgi:acyl-CoA reductase-like NAD-dependent aldehyde dehydrogenase